MNEMVMTLSSKMGQKCHSELKIPFHRTNAYLCQTHYWGAHFSCLWWWQWWKHAKSFM